MEINEIIELIKQDAVKQRSSGAPFDVQPKLVDLKQFREILGNPSDAELKDLAKKLRTAGHRAIASSCPDPFGVIYQG